MSFISINFIVLFISTFILFYTLNAKYRKYVLLLSSAVFIGFYHIGFLITAVFISLATYYFGQWVDASKREKRRNCSFIVSIGILIGVWLAFRYANPLMEHFRALIGLTASTETSHANSILFPLGISFYTFQAMSYLTEIYWQEEKPEKDLSIFMVYMLFFMKFLSGPIERPGELLPQLRRPKPINYNSLVYGTELIVTGMIKKLVLADYLAPYLDGIFGSIHSASGVQLLMACLLYPVEIYGDFSGYTDMALGGARLFGLQLAPNFNRPFAALTTSDFWRRWHMSLSFWIRDYLYLPLSSALRRHGQTGVFLSLFLTFVGLGVWHGAGWNYVAYGVIQGVVIFYEMKTSTFRKKVKNWLGNPIFITLSIIRTYLIFAVSLLFFRLDSLSSAIYYIKNISFQVNTSWKELNIGMSDHNCIVASSALVLILIYEYLMSKHNLFDLLAKQPTWVRWGIYYLLAIVLFSVGQFSSDSFIYLQF